MSFWTGLATGVASSVDRALQTAMTQDDAELSAAKKFWRERRAAKLEKEEEKKEAYDKKAEEAYNFLADELADPTMAYAVMKKLGGAEGALDYVNKVKAKREILQPGEKYDVRKDFVGYKAGETTLTREQGLQQSLYKIPSSVFAPVSAADLAVDSRIDKFFGREGQAAGRAAESLNKQFASLAPEKVAPVTGVGTIERIDRSRLIAAQQEKERVAKLGREEERFSMDVSAFKQNARRVDQAMQIAAAAEERAALDRNDRIAQQEFENARAAAQDAQTLARLEREAEIHILDVRSKKQDIEKTELDILKEKQHPIFKDFEDMYVYATQKLADKGLSADKRAEYEMLKQNAIDGAKAYKRDVPDDKKESAVFAKDSRQSILNNEIKRVLEPKGLMTDIQGKIEYKIKGNEVVYFANMVQALDNVTAQTKDLEDGQMNALIQSQRDDLQKDVSLYIEDVAAGKKQGKTLHTMADSASASNVTFTKNLKVGDVVKYKIRTADAQLKEVARIWTGTRYIRGY